MRKFAQWLVSVSRHWGTLVTSGAVIGGLGVWQGTDHRVPPSVYWIVAVLGLITAFYRAWAVEHDARNDGQRTIYEQVTRLAGQEERYKEAVEESRSAEQRLKDEVARLHALQLQPQFRFEANQRSFGSEMCDALELWNDGAAVDLHSIRQASYIELSFTFDPSTPDAGARFAAAVEARYGLGFGYAFGHILEERINLDHIQELLRHPTNPLGFGAEYTLSLQDEWDVKCCVNFTERILMPLVRHLGIASKADPGPETAAIKLVAPTEQPLWSHVRYIPSYYFHRRDYEATKQPGKLVTFYAWQDGNPGTNYTREFARLREEIYQRFGIIAGATVSRRTFLSLVYTDKAGTRHECTFDVYPRDPWGAMVAMRVTEPLDLRMAFDVDMRRITGDSVLSLCTVPPALRSLSQEQRVPAKAALSDAYALKKS